MKIDVEWKFLLLIVLLFILWDYMCVLNVFIFGEYIEWLFVCKYVLIIFKMIGFWIYIYIFNGKRKLFFYKVVFVCFFEKEIFIFYKIGWLYMLWWYL